MGIKQSAMDEWEAERRFEIWKQRFEMISPRTSEALRLMLGLSIKQTAARIGLPGPVVSGFKSQILPLENWPSVSREVNAAYAQLGGRWYDPDLHEGAYCVFLTQSEASAGQAILAALAILPSTRQTLAKRIAASNKSAQKQFLAALAGRVAIPNNLLSRAFAHLHRADCHFRRGEKGGFVKVGCAPYGRASL